MKHIKRFNESLESSSEKESTKFGNVTHVLHSGETIDELERALGYTVDQIQEATDQKVKDISGTHESQDFDLDVILDDGAKISLYYTYAPYPNPQRRSGIIYVDYTSPDGERISKNDQDSDVKAEMKRTNLDEMPIFLILMTILSGSKGKEIVIELPRHDFDTAGFMYDIDNESRGYTMIRVAFATKEDAQKWLAEVQSEIDSM